MYTNSGTRRQDRLHNNVDVNPDDKQVKKSSEYSRRS